MFIYDITNYFGIGKFFERPGLVVPHVLYETGNYYATPGQLITLIFALEYMSSASLLPCLL